MNATSTAGDFPHSNGSNVADELPIASHLYWSFGSYADPDGIIALSFVVRGIAVPVIAFIGIVANALNMVVLSKLKKLKRVPIYEILLSMTAADFAIVMCYFVDSMLFITLNSTALDHLKDRNLNEVKEYIYRTLNPIINFFGFISHWNTTSVAAFRFIAVYFPLRAAEWCTPRMRRTTIVCTIILAFLVFPLLLSLMFFVPALGSHENELWVFFTTIAIFLPWILSVVLVSLLLASLHSRPANGLATQQSRDRLRGEHRMLTVMLMFTAAWFAVTNAPNAIFNVLVYKVGYPYSKDERVHLVRLNLVANIMLMLNYCGNFFFYSWINKCHRKQLRELISSCNACKNFD